MIPERNNSWIKKIKLILLLAVSTVLHLTAGAQVMLPSFFGVQHKRSGALTVTSIDNAPALGSFLISVKVNAQPSPSENGIVYNTTGSPTTANSKVTAGTGSGNYSFQATISNLSASVPSISRIYYIRPYLITSSGTTFYGSEYAFTFFDYYIGSLQSFTVPNNVDSLTMQAIGAQGGSLYSYGSPYTATGGYGAAMKGTFRVIPAESLDILVGSQGGSVTNYGNSSNASTPGGGGGAFIIRKSTNGNPVPLLVAGGGAGATWCAYNGVYTPANTFRYDGRPGLKDSVGAGSIYVNNPPEYNPTYSGGSNGGGGQGMHSGGGGGFRGNGGSYPSSNGTPYNAWGRAYPGTGGWNSVDGNCYGGYGGGGAGFNGPWTGGGGGGGFSGGAGTTTFQRAGGAGSYNSGTRQDNYDGDVYPYRQGGNARVILSWKKPL